MKILSIEFTPNWSWGLIFEHFKRISGNDIERIFMSDKPKEISENADITLVQNVTLLDKVKNKIKSICRLGGNRSFENREIDHIINGMSQCYALIATNNKLYQIAKTANENTYLIPNALSLEEWKPRSRFVVGFCANISSDYYRHYKGYDYVKDACDSLGVELKTALYKNQQIPHDRMMQDFYHQIDCIVHPTMGEGCSNTLMEACACGVPIITTTCAGYHGEEMQDRIDVLFCERSTESIRDKILLLINNQALRGQLSAGARAFAEKHHNIEVVARQYDEIFNACHKANKGQIIIKDNQPVISDRASRKSERLRRVPRVCRRSRPKNRKDVS